MGTVCSWEALQVLTASAEKFQLCFLWPRARMISGSCCHDMIATFIFILRHFFLVFTLFSLTQSSKEPPLLLHFSWLCG